MKINGNYPELNPDIIARFREGDARAFTTFFEMHYRPLCYFASQLVGVEDAEDIVKDTYVKLWQKHEDFATDKTIKAFLYITTKNACLNFIRHVKVRENSQKELVYLEEKKGDQLVLNRMIRAELMQAIYAEIEKLSEKRRMVFKMAYIEGLKNEEISRLLDISIHTVKEHKGKALQTLRIKFGENDLGLFLLLLANFTATLIIKN